MTDLASRIDLCRVENFGGQCQENGWESKMDRYSKGILSVIAVALWIIVVQNAVSSASAQLGDSCGDRYDPCFVEIEGPLGGTRVYVTNLP